MHAFIRLCGSVIGHMPFHNAATIGIIITRIHQLFSSTALQYDAAVLYIASSSHTIIIIDQNARNVYAHTEHIVSSAEMCC